MMEAKVELADLSMLRYVELRTHTIALRALFGRAVACLPTRFGAARKRLIATRG